MAIDANAPSSGGGITQWIEQHPSTAISAAILIALALGGLFLRRIGPQVEAPETEPALTGDLSGLSVDSSGRPIIYVPVETSFSTYNYIEDSYNSTTTSNTTTTNNPPPIFTPGPVTSTPPKPPTPPKPVPPTRKPGLHWDQRYTIKSGDTLSGIAWGVGNWLHINSGMPRSITISAAELYSRNKATIDRVAASMGYPVSRNPMDNLLPGTVLITPRWDKGS